MTEHSTANPTRNAIFISHANPEDNPFVRWLGAKLTAMGFEIWADVLKLHGGVDWSRELEAALRLRTRKMLLVCTPKGLDKQGVRNEIQIGAQLASELKDSDFIIPLRLQPFQAPFNIVQAQYIDFSAHWSTGFAELVDLLVNTHKIAPTSATSTNQWLVAQTTGATRLVQQREPLISNWLMVNKFPRYIRYCEPFDPTFIIDFQNRDRHRWPIVPFKNGILTLAAPDSEGRMGTDVGSRVVRQFSLHEFLEAGWDFMEIDSFVARRQFSDLGNQAFEAGLRSFGLKSYEGANARFSWWGDIRTAPRKRIPFNWPGWSGSRQIIGASGKRKVHWHYAISGELRTGPIRHLRLSARLIFSENGFDALTDPKKMHRLRRSFAKSWRNARWRDMMLAFLWWISDGGSEIQLLISNDQELSLGLPPATFECPVSVVHSGDIPPDEDDPDVEFDYWYESDDGSDEMGVE
jgi:hypothetical protein